VHSYVLKRLDHNIMTLTWLLGALRPRVGD